MVLFHPSFLLGSLEVSPILSNYVSQNSENASNHKHLALTGCATPTSTQTVCGSRPVSGPGVDRLFDPNYLLVFGFPHFCLLQDDLYLFRILFLANFVAPVAKGWLGWS